MEESIPLVGFNADETKKDDDTNVEVRPRKRSIRFFLQNPSLITIFQNLAQYILLYHDKYKRIQRVKVCSIKNDQVWEKSQCWVFKWTATRQKPKSIKSTQNAWGDWNGGMMLTVYI